MKLLQVVLCVVLALLGRVVTQSKMKLSGQFSQTQMYRWMNYYRNEEIEFKKKVMPAHDYNVNGDAMALFAAMSRSEINKTAIIDILSHRSIQQRLNIANEYKRIYRTSLVKNLECKLEGDFGKVIVALMTPLDLYYVTEMRTALFDWNTAEEDIVEIILSLSNEGIQFLASDYENKFERPLKDDVIERLGNRNFAELITKLLKVKRTENIPMDIAKAHADAEAIRINADPNISELIPIFTSRIFSHLNETFAAYKRTNGKDIKTLFNEAEEEGFKTGMRAIVRRAKGRLSYFAHQLRYKMGVNSLIRIIVGRSEVDLRAILDEYKKLYGRELRADLTAKYQTRNKDLLDVLDALIK